ncbi:carboxy terminal-processing peptidase [Flavobacterium sp. xlx-214]|uniref:carboxy terminal-processing peptidase n=1 Tax=unclassified Flavobacterium TaxID=196869 RepID=UPI0013D765FA|nr:MULTISPECIES: carboxy terminal-processing peptidase [unclassified Flavobacterium]MBA5791209.1 carboxy terminal-processing peptidase [Flavobacterium sp. xlx-221]QMI83622.1 carboxy terminal-processing peptidase [Flavobacterium sp. xlx-214]
MTAIWQFMKRNYKVILVVVALAAALWSFVPFQKSKDPDPEKEAFLLGVLSFVLQNAHYHPADVNDAFSQKVYTNYLKVLDGNKRFLLQSDVDGFKKYETLIDDEFKTQKIDFFNATYPVVQSRITEAKTYYKEILEKPFDLTKKETLNTDYEKQPFASNKEDLKERWRKQLKLSVLSSIEDKMKLQENDSLQKEPKKSLAEIEKEARETTLKSLNDYFEFFQEISREEWLSIYINTILEQFDPHTNYFAPDDKKKFDESMAGSMEGIGAILRKKDQYTEILEVVPGGPAMKQGELENGDVILKVAQGNEEPVDIGGMRQEKVVKMIKGKKGTVVNLTVKKVDGSIKVISITRDKFEIEDTFAKSSIIDTPQGKYGLIHLPKFYISFENRDNRDAFKDVAKEVAYLKEQKVDGIIMDLRNNGGGSLQTVVDMVGLFIPQGPVVQVKAKSGENDVLYDRDNKTQWEGPLVVLINNYSASASEIFAAAIQDYNRGLVLGSKHSYGKGTVQNMLDLNRFGNKKIGDLGGMKFTSQKFYRVNGGSTQLKGVESDVILPDRFLYVDTGERDNDTAMQWDKIAKANFNPFGNNFAPIIEKSKKRIAANKEFQLIDESAKWVKSQQDDNTFSLQYDEYMAKSKELDAQTKKFNALKDYKNTLVFKSLPHDEALIKTDTVLQNKRKRWFKSLNNDVYVEEAVNVLKDINSIKK